MKLINIGFGNMVNADRVIAGIVSGATSRAVFQQMKKNSDFDSLPTSDANTP